MSDEQMRIAIAEAMGFRAEEWTQGGWMLYQGDKRVHHPLDGTASKESCFLRHTPDYLNDLNAMHEAEKVLTEKGVNAWWAYVAHINRNNPTPFGAESAVHATARQRAEAFIKTLNPKQP